MSGQVLEWDAYRTAKTEPTRKSPEWNIEYLAKAFKTLKVRVDALEDGPVYSETELFGQISARYALKHPVKVTLEIYPDETVAIIPTLELYGEGFTEIEAIDNLKLELIDLLEDLGSIADEDLGKDLRNRKKTINDLIVRQ